jgi:ribosomal protein S18 acetylase RimI-like enzyme
VYADATIHLHRLEYGDRRSVLEVFRALSDVSRRLRFLGPKPALADDELARLVDVGCCGREAVAAVESATGRTVGIGRFVREGDSPDAEIAFAVADDWQGRGVGTVLLDELKELARHAGIERFRATVSASNDAALALVRRAGSVVSARLEDGAYELMVELR